MFFTPNPEDKIANRNLRIVFFVVVLYPGPEAPEFLSDVLFVASCVQSELFGFLFRLDVFWLSNYYHVCYCATISVFIATILKRI